jgi:hypothetical protein
MASSMKSGGDAAYLQERRNALKIAEKRIEAVDAELTAARDGRAAILRDIAQFNASRAPISRVPLEVFPLIFENWKGDPFTRNRTLSLVCKTWHNIVWNATSFWTDVVIRPGWEVDKLDTFCRFAQLCHQLSKDKPLDVTMDFSAIIPYPVYVGRVLDENSNRFPFIPPQNVHAFAKASVQAYDEPYQDAYLYPFKFYYDQTAKNFMKKLVGQSNEHVRRWRSLRITIPNDLDGPAAQLVLHEMKGNMEGLIELEVLGRCNNGMNILEAAPPQLAHLSNLRRLTTNQDINFDQIRVNYAVLTHISLKNSHASAAFIYTAFSDFVATTTLELDFLGYTDPFAFDPAEKVLLPQLTHLKLAGAAFRCQAALVQIEAPKLEHLHLQQNIPFFCIFEAIQAPLLSQVLSLLVQGRANRTKSRGTQGVTYSYSYEALKATLRQSSDLVNLRVAKGDWGDAENVRRVVTEVMEEEARPLRRLKEVIIVQCDEQGENFMTEDQEIITRLTMSAPPLEPAYPSA